MSKFGKGGKVDRSNIEDRRAQEPMVKPSDPDALLYGLPMTPHEFELWKQKAIQREQYRQGIQPQPRPEPMIPGLVPDYQPGPRDPAGLEARRKAILERYQADQAAIAELDRRLNAMKKAPKR